MAITEKSWRSAVEKWLPPCSTTAIRVTRFSRTRASRWRYVCVEMQRPINPVALLFFRHDDGTWCVFPPEAPRLTVHPHASAA